MYLEEDREAISIFASWTGPKSTKGVSTTKNYG